MTDYQSPEEIKPNCSKCKSKLEKKFQLRPQDLERKLIASFCWQCPDCKNIQEI